MNSGNCHNCHDYRLCIGKEWYNFSEIKWCIWQVIWILTNCEVLQSGRWPKELYSDNEGQRTIKTEASFVKPILIWAEVDKRLKRTGTAGKLLCAQIKAGETFDTLDDEAREALMYVKGLKRKKSSFRRWVRETYHSKTCVVSQSIV
jgi:hypothetical protein